MKLASIFAASCAILASMAQAKPVHTEPSHNQGQTGPNGAKYVKGRQFDRIFQIVFENHDVWPVHADPWFGQFWKQDNHRLLGNYHAITHVSQPNYVNMIAGSDFGDNMYNDINGNPDAMKNISLVAGSDMPINFTSSASTVIDVLEQAGISWRAYAEGYPIQQGCDFDYMPGYPDFVWSEGNHTYTRRHFPFISFPSVTSKKERCNNLFNSDQFFEDYKNGELPQYVYYVPNLENDMHDSNTTYGSLYVQHTWKDIFDSKYFMENALNIFTFDESANFTLYDMNNQVYTVIWGSGVETHSAWDHIDWAYYNHTSLISTIEDNWLGKIGQLGTNDTYANVISVKKPWTN